MAKDNNADNLRLKPGKEIPSKREGIEAYKIVKFLGAGATSNVYLADVIPDQDGSLPETGQQVALKVLKPGLGEKLTADFFQEATILRQLRDKEDKAGFPHAIPECFEEEDDENKTRFLALAMAPGISLGSLLTPVGKYLDEQVALTIVAQLARVLDLLHTKLERSYKDFQLQNIFWDAENQRITIIDWNQVTNVGDANKQHDLTLTGYYLYRMLTGKEVALVKQNELSTLGLRGATAYTLEHRAGKERWTAISLASRRLIQRAVHPTVARRFADANELYAATERILKLWNDTLSSARVSEILGRDSSPETVEAQSALLKLGEADQRQKQATVEDAEEVLDFLERRKFLDNPELIANLKALIERSADALSQPWTAGKIFFDTADFPRAVNLWQELVEASGEVRHFRWLALAQTGVKNGQDFTKIRRDAAVKALKALEEKSYDHARTEFQKLLGELSRRTVSESPYGSSSPQSQDRNNQEQVTGLAAILCELEARALIDKAQKLQSEGKYRDAAEKIREADKCLSRIP